MRSSQKEGERGELKSGGSEEESQEVQENGKKVGMTVAKQRDVSRETVQTSVRIYKRMWER